MTGSQMRAGAVEEILVPDTRRWLRLRRLSNGIQPLTRIGSDPRDSSEERVRKALLVTVCLMILPAGVLWGALYWTFGERIPALIPWGYVVLSVAALATFATTRSFRLLRTAELLLILLLPAALSVALGGLLPSNGVILWSLLAPLGALVFDRPRRAWLWFAAFIGLLAVDAPLGSAVRMSEVAFSDDVASVFAGLNIGGPSLVAFTLLAAFAIQRENAEQRLVDLLVNVLPGDIVERLQEEDWRIADHVDGATILFADVVDFTALSSRLRPEEVVGLLDELFSEFDDLADRHGVEKIKTIGDCYMVAAGVPRPRPDHAQALARMALEMRDCVRRYAGPGREDRLELRIGMNSGEVVAGVIGRRRFIYDLWGDAVNIASRMESHGAPGRIQISRATRELLGDEFVCEARGTIEVKGRGEVEAFYLHDLASEPATAAAKSPPPAEIS
jgi:adenylate cyclase